ncbi:uncharacterized protein N7469_002999 [Penicillium citrinum]|uniref:Uncharacterized protein n=2 Tax=Penicillium TaxID=5073 RepID=A0A9W9PDR2_PENCI|nr:uncharacterized protein N7469_002999 [Penicillium citrinum]KAJ5241408.1 hypothetical protein N7469_002999 [Penicillium citrinum]KAJ5586414.1 hypothetical protein N7450_006201 [Penicillium hetheringtonii]
METAPLSLAHTHARNAVLETRKSNPVAASEEHDLAAGEFASALQSSSDHEYCVATCQALRTLKLLESHHKKLAEILRFQHENHTTANTLPSSSNITSYNQTTQPVATESAHTKPTNQDAQAQPSRPPRLASRESSSIASNLASARGIPSQVRRSSPASPTLSSHQAGAKMTEGPSSVKTGESRLREAPKKNRQSRASASRQPWSPPLPSTSEIGSHQVVPRNTGESSQSSPKTGVTDEPFQRFYSTFEGLVSRISAPLAFAGLPLASEDPAKTGPANRKSPAEAKIDRHHATHDRKSSLQNLDVSRLFSRAALRSIQDTPGAGTGNAAESFYVVPTTGGTMSYAGILTRAEKEARRNSLDDGEDDFVDAREVPSSPEMLQSANKKSSTDHAREARGKFNALQNPKTLEELQMENQALKQLSDTLSKRLHMWEVNAQSSSMALHQSLRAMHHQNTGSPDQLSQGLSGATSIAGPSMSESDPRVKELEEIVRRGEQELDRVGRENEKLKNVLGRYRDRWEKLKEGAKTRRESRATDGESSKKPDTPASPHLDSDSPNRSETEGKAEGHDA